MEHVCNPPLDEVGLDKWRGPNWICPDCNKQYRSNGQVWLAAPRQSEEVRKTSSTGAQKGAKPARYDLIPPKALELVARLYGRGAEKYEDHNWRAGYDWSLSYAALNRHLWAFWNGEDMDEEMGLPHLACVIFHAMTLLTYMDEHPEFDDRYSTRKRLTDG